MCPVFLKKKGRMEISKALGLGGNRGPLHRRAGPRKASVVVVVNCLGLPGGTQGVSNESAFCLH